MQFLKQDDEYVYLYVLRVVVVILCNAAYKFKYF